MSPAKARAPRAPRKPRRSMSCSGRRWIERCCSGCSAMSGRTGLEFLVSLALLPWSSPVRGRAAVPSEEGDRRAHRPSGGWSGSTGWACAYLGMLLGQYGAGFGRDLPDPAARPAGDERAARRRSTSTCCRCRRSSSNRTPVGRLMTRMTSDIEALNEMFASGMVSLLGDIVRLAFILVAIFGIDWRLALFSMATAPVLFGIAGSSAGWVRDAFREIRMKLARMNAFLQEHLSGMKVGAGLRAGGARRRRVRRHQPRLPPRQRARHHRRRRAAIRSSRRSAPAPWRRCSGTAATGSRAGR